MALSIRCIRERSCRRGFIAADAVRQADRYLKTGEKPATEKQLFGCLLITPDNGENYTAPFVLEQ